MDDLLTTRQVQGLLKVDRITVYRMLQDGRIRGIKVGQQWRFPSQEVERIVKGETIAEDPVPAAVSTFPTHCVQTIQDLFSDVGQVSALVIDQTGEPLTEVSHGCAFCERMLSNPSGRAACRESWRKFAEQSGNGGKTFTCHAGLQYVGAPIFDREQQVGLFLAGQFTWQPADEREQRERLRGLVSAHAFAFEDLAHDAAKIPVVSTEQRVRVEGWPATAARAVQSILHERIGFMKRLQKIADLTQI